MLPYGRIASLLDDIGRADRSKKPELAASFLFNLSSEQLCVAMRLLSGELWPAWSLQQMRMGPEAVAEALQEISLENVRLLRMKLGEIGAVAEAALLKKSQSPISYEPLEAMHVYESLLRISKQSGSDSERRRRAILQGLFLEATPAESKYIARTVMKNMQVDLGPQTMIAAISKVFDVDLEEVRRAYCLMPELGMVTMAASRGDLGSVKMRPCVPIKPIIFRHGEVSDVGIARAYLARPPGLRVQLHKKGSDFFIFTKRLKNITAAMESLSRDILCLGHELIVEADLVGFQDGKMVGQAEMVGFINHRHRSKRSSVLPALIASDLLYLDGEDLTGQGYAERRKLLEYILGKPKRPPFTGVSIAEEKVLKASKEVQEYCRWAIQSGMDGLLSRDLNAPYLAGGLSRRDWLIKRAYSRG